MVKELGKHGNRALNMIACNLQDRVLTIRFKREAKRNALTSEMYVALADAFRAATTDDEVGAVVLTGGESCFSAGNDLASFLSEPPQNLEAPVFRFMTSVVELDKPLIAAVCGAAIGVGTTVLTHCDLVYVTRKSRFALPFVRLGLCPEFGSSLTLPMIVGAARARHLLLTGEDFYGLQAFEWGLATHLFETPQECLEMAAEQARKFACFPKAALLSSKKLLKRVSLDDLRKGICEEGETLIKLLKTKETSTALGLLVR